MSFNIRWPVGEDKGAKDWENRKEAVVKLINNSGANVIGLQEIHTKREQLAYIKENLASKYEIIYFGDKETNATIYDKRVFNLVSQDQYWLSETPDVQSLGWGSTCYLAAGILILEHKATGEMVRVINTHGALNDEATVKGVELIANRSLSGESQPLTFMLGDFNAKPNQLGYVSIAEKLQDCRVAAQKSPNRENRTYNGFKDTGGAIIDYCFVSKSERVNVLSYQVRDERWGEGNYISDHFAVQTTVRIQKSEHGA